MTERYEFASVLVNLHGRRGLSLEVCLGIRRKTYVLDGDMKELEFGM